MSDIVLNALSMVGYAGLTFLLIRFIEQFYAKDVPKKEKRKVSAKEEGE